jgi:hypothetical protein
MSHHHSSRFAVLGTAALLASILSSGAFAQPGQQGNGASATGNPLARHMATTRGSEPNLLALVGENAAPGGNPGAGASRVTRSTAQGVPSAAGNAASPTELKS